MIVTSSSNREGLRLVLSKLDEVLELHANTIVEEIDVDVEEV